MFASNQQSHSSSVVVSLCMSNFSISGRIKVDHMAHMSAEDRYCSCRRWHHFRAVITKGFMLPRGFDQLKQYIFLERYSMSLPFHLMSLSGRRATEAGRLVGMALDSDCGIAKLCFTGWMR